jgi:hypothetical protein
LLPSLKEGDGVTLDNAPHSGLEKESSNAGDPQQLFITGGI